MHLAQPQRDERGLRALPAVHNPIGATRGALRSAVLAAGFILAAAADADAHVVIAPADSPAGATQLYTLVVPSENLSDTVRIEVQFPRPLVVLQLEAPSGWQVTPQKDGSGHILGAVWDGGKTPAGELLEVGVLAQNPGQPADLAWSVIQSYADGNEVQWIGPATSQFPAAITRVRGGGLTPTLADLLAGAALVCSVAALALATLAWRRGRRAAPAGLAGRPAQASDAAGLEAAASEVAGDGAQQRPVATR